MTKSIMVIFLSISALYLLALAALYVLQRSVLYIPPSMYFTPIGVNLESAVEVPILDDTANILGWWMQPKDDNAPVVMFFHGNGSAVYSNHEIYRELHAQGYGVFALAYPAYPGRAGTTTQESLTAAAVGGYDYIAAQGVSAERVAFYGTSLGAGVAAQLAVRRRPALIIMEAPFTSAADMAQLSFPVFPARLLTKDKFRSDAALAGTDIPMVWLHGTQDRVIPFSVGQDLFEGYDGPKSSFVIEGGGHNDLWYRGGREVIMKQLNQLRTKESVH